MRRYRRKEEQAGWVASAGGDSCWQVWGWGPCDSVEREGKCRGEAGVCEGLDVGCPPRERPSSGVARSWGLRQPVQVVPPLPPFLPHPSQPPLLTAALRQHLTLGRSMGGAGDALGGRGGRKAECGEACGGSSAGESAPAWEGGRGRHCFHRHTHDFATVMQSCIRS